MTTRAELKVEAITVYYAAMQNALALYDATVMFAEDSFVSDSTRAWEIYGGTQTKEK